MKRLPMFLILAAAFSFLLLSSGCGQSGPLYIPGNPSKMAVPPSRKPTTEEEEEEESDPSETE